MKNSLISGANEYFDINIGDAVCLTQVETTDLEEIVVLRANRNRFFYLTRTTAEQILKDKKPINLSTMFDDEIAECLVNCAKGKMCTRCILFDSNLCNGDLMKEAAKRLGSSDYMKELVFTAINTRYQSNKPMIVTTNLTQNEITAMKDIDRMRIYDRISDCCIPIEAPGRSIRRKLSAENNKDVKDWLTKEEE